VAKPGDNINLLVKKRPDKFWSSKALFIFRKRYGHGGRVHEIKITDTAEITGGRHYSDRLCSDRRYSDNLQAVRPSTSLARLAHVEIGKKLEWVEALDASKARH